RCLGRWVRGPRRGPEPAATPAKFGLAHPRPPGAVQVVRLRAAPVTAGALVRAVNCVAGVPQCPPVAAVRGSGWSKVPGDFVGGGCCGPAFLVGEGVVSPAEQ